MRRRWRRRAIRRSREIISYNIHGRRRDMSKKKKSWDIFLSYSSADRAKAETILSDLEAIGLSVWYDRKQILGGDLIRENINAGIRGSKSILILASPSSLKSRWVMNELDAAMIREIEERRKLVVPVLLGNIQTKQLPEDLQGKNYIDLRFQFRKRYARHRAALLNSLQAISEPQTKSLNEIPINEDGIRQVLTYRYVGVGEKSRIDDDFISSLADAFIESSITGKDADEMTAARDNFVQKFGRWGVRQLIGFHMDHSNISFSGGFTEKEFGNFMWGLNLFMLIFDGQTKLAEGETVLMGTKQGEDLRYRISRHPKWKKYTGEGKRKKRRG